MSSTFARDHRRVTQLFISKGRIVLHDEATGEDMPIRNATTGKIVFQTISNDDAELDATANQYGYFHDETRHGSSRSWLPLSGLDPNFPDRFGSKLTHEPDWKDVNDCVHYLQTASAEIQKAGLILKGFELGQKTTYRLFVDAGGFFQLRAVKPRIATREGRRFIKVTQDGRQVVDETPWVYDHDTWTEELHDKPIIEKNSLRLLHV
jgi:hypothetical protein